MEEEDELLHNIVELFQNQVLWCAVAAWFIAQAMKILTYWLVEKKLDFMRFFGSGGMPSSHSAFVTALAIMVGATDGFSTAGFAIAIVLAAVVMYDASGVRHETGVQGQVLNEIIQKVFVDGQPITDVELKELVGHTKVEVAGGFVVGVLTALGFIFL
ncbi:MAG: divergent PAP2 family protein [Clostridia bacterium]|nr:divergent PAP2 family protein [Clostridia bacterium]